MELWDEIMKSDYKIRSAAWIIIEIAYDHRHELCQGEWNDNKNNNDEALQ